MAALAKLYRQYHKRLSIKGFMRVVGQPYWRLRDYLPDDVRQVRQFQVQPSAAKAVADVAGAQPTSGYRRVYQTRRQPRAGIGRERVRRLRGALGLQPPPPMKKKRPAPMGIAERAGPQGRRLQMDATRFRLDDGIAWVYSQSHGY